MKSEGFVFKTVDQYTSSRVSLKQEMSSKSGKGSDSLFGKAGKSTKKRKNMRLWLVGVLFSADADRVLSLVALL